MSEAAIHKCSYKKMFWNMQQITGEHTCESSISIKLVCNFRLQHGCSSVNLLHILRTSFSKNTSGWLLMKCILIKKVSTCKKSQNFAPMKVCLWLWASKGKQIELETFRVHFFQIIKFNYTGKEKPKNVIFPLHFPEFLVDWIFFAYIQILYKYNIKYSKLVRETLL